MELHDVHEATTPATPEAAWAALPRVLARAFDTRRARALAAALGCRERAASGTPTRTGATLPGFVVVEADAPRRLVLEGRHRFATYRLALEAEPREGGATLRARTDATFPGPHGALYRVLVLAPFHAPVTRRILRGWARVSTSARRPS